MSSRESTNYLNEVERLNQGQRKAYDSQGHCAVLAGPGSGKTRVLVTKMARMLAEDIRPPRGIACITYSNQCAKELKKRLETMGIDENSRTFIGTVHSFCLWHIIAPYFRLAHLDIPVPIKIATKKQQKDIFAKAFERIDRNNNPLYHKTEFDRFRRTVLDRDSATWYRYPNNYANLVIQYEQMLYQNGILDFDDIVLKALSLVEKHEWIRKAIKAKFPVLLVDEYQDLGVPLHKIVLSLCLESGIRLFAVGDPDQSIYGFTGARPSLLNELAEHNDVEKVQLRMNYRSGRSIIAGSAAVLATDRQYLAANEEEGIIQEHYIRSGFDDQIQYIVGTLIPSLLTDRPGCQPGDIAILYKDRYDGEAIASHIDASHYKYTRFDQSSPYQRTALTIWLEDCASWCTTGWKSGNPKLSNIIQAWVRLVPHLRTDAEIRELRKKTVAFLFRNRQSEDMPLQDWLQSFVDVGLKNYLMEEQSISDECETFAEMVTASQDTQNRLSQYTVSQLGNQRGAPDHLNLTTYHGSKGLEYDVVIMPGLEQGRVPDSRDDKAEARRKFYVAMTRARHEVHFLWSGWYMASRQRYENGRSVFIDDVMQRLEHQ